MYYRGAKAAVIVYDIESKNSFDRAKDWISGTKFNIFLKINFLIKETQILRVGCK